MTYNEALQKALTVKWKVQTCNSGENCWCRGIIPEEPIFDDKENEILIVGWGEVHREHAEHIVALHNSIIQQVKE